MLADVSVRCNRLRDLLRFFRSSGLALILAASRSRADSHCCPEMALHLPLAALFGGRDSGCACDLLLRRRNAERPVQAKAGDNGFLAPHIIPLAQKSL